MRKACVILLLSAMTAMGTSCSLYQRMESQNEKTESMLADAGFTKVPIETPLQHTAVDGLPLRKLNRYSSTDGTVFWYADPDRCQCLYEGDQHAFDRYAMALKQSDDTTAYARESNGNELASLGTFGYWFPPPVGYGTWMIFASTGGDYGGSNDGGAGAGLSAGAHGFGAHAGGFGHR